MLFIYLEELGNKNSSKELSIIESNILESKSKKEEEDEQVHPTGKLYRPGTCETSKSTLQGSCMGPEPVRSASPSYMEAP